MKKQFLALAVLLQLFVGCSNDDNKSSVCEDNLPAITTTGANTFGCCINGNLLIPRDGEGTNGGSEKGFKTWGDPSGNNEYVEIDIRDYKSERTGSLVLHIQGLNQLNTGDYILDESNGYTSIDGLFHNYVHCKVFNETTKSYQYYRSYDNSGTLKITRYDFANRIISGTFNCKVKNSTNENDIIEIKDGRFDLNWQTLPNVSFP
jgi:hypothetical protein